MKIKEKEYEQVISDGKFAIELEKQFYDKYEGYTCKKLKETHKYLKKSLVTNDVDLQNTFLNATGVWLAIGLSCLTIVISMMIAAMGEIPNAPSDGVGTVVGFILLVILAAFGIILGKTWYQNIQERRKKRYAIVGMKCIEKILKGRKKKKRK